MANRDDILAMFKRRNPKANPVLVDNVMPVTVRNIDDYKDEPMIFSPADGASIRVQKLHVLSQLIFDTVGPQGPTGDTGAPGVDGTDGIDGDTIIVGNTIPSQSIGKDGDLYLNEISFNLFEKVSGAWHYLGRIKGDPGMGIQPMGEATVAEVNAITDAKAGDVWIMLDAGTIVDGSGGNPMDVIANDWIGWGESDANWMNLGQMQGIQGDTGPQGDTANVTAGTTTTLAAGTDATVTSITTDNDVVLNFGIPQGAKGDQGDTGATGADSVVPGPTGPGGITAAGATTTLAAGESATVAEAASSVPTATVWDFGIPQGIQGIKGDTGDTGVQGPGGTNDIGTTTTLAPGLDATVEESDTSTPEARVWDFGIPEGLKGDTGDTAQVVTPLGASTVAELNALVVDPIVGGAYWMVDTGTVTYGTPDCVVNATNEVLVWVADGYFFNMGVLAVGSSWDQTTGVTVDGSSPADGDDLANMAALGDYLPLTGGEMSGDIVLQFDRALRSIDSGGTPQLMFVFTTGDVAIFGSNAYSTKIRGLEVEFENAVPITAIAQGTAVNELTRKDYVDTKEPGLGNAGTAGFVLSDDGAGVRAWITPQSGPQGDPGADGATGDAGADGAPGADGATGSAGYSPVVTIGTVGSVPAGTAPTVVDGDTGPDVLLNFTLEAGATGSTGPTGGAGPTAVSADAGNQATLGVDSLLYVGGLVASDTADTSGSDAVTNMVSCTQAEYDAGPKTAGVFYIIVG